MGHPPPGSLLPVAGLKRASVFEALSVIQKLIPSLAAPEGVPGPVGKNPSAVRSAAFQRETVLAPLAALVTRIRWPSKAATKGKFNPLPFRAPRTAPFEARTTVIELTAAFGTQIFAPSKAGNFGPDPTVTVWSTAAFESSFKSLPAASSVTQMFEPS